MQMKGGKDMKKIALIVGHSKFRQGARNKKSGLTEYKYNKSFVEKLYEKLLYVINFNCCFQFQIFYRKIGMKTLHRRINEYAPDIAIEFHCNAVKDKKISGAEMLIPKYLYDLNERTGIATLNVRISNILNIRHRGLKEVHKHQRGGKFLHNINAELKFIAEPFFISNDSDLEKALNNQDKLIDVFVEFIKDLN